MEEREEGSGGIDGRACSEGNRGITWCLEQNVGSRHSYGFLFFVFKDVWSQRLCPNGDDPVEKYGWSRKRGRIAAVSSLVGTQGWALARRQRTCFRTSHRSTRRKGGVAELHKSVSEWGSLGGQRRGGSLRDWRERREETKWVNGREKIRPPGSTTTCLILEIMNSKCFCAFVQPHSVLLMPSWLRRGVVFFRLYCCSFSFEETRPQWAGAYAQCLDSVLDHRIHDE